MKYFIKLILVLMFSVQSFMAYAGDVPSEISDGEVYYPPVDKPKLNPEGRVCTDCIIAGTAVVGQVVSVNGFDWKLVSFRTDGIWNGRFLGQSVPSVYAGRTADETFGTTKHSLSNNEAIRWMNVGYSKIDSVMDDFKPEFRVKIRNEIFENTTFESNAVIKKVKENLKTKSGNDNSFICPDFECSAVLQSFATNTNALQPIEPNQSSDVFMGDLYNNLPSSEPFAADQVGQSGKYIDTKPYLSSHQEELNKERDRLNDSRAQGPQQWDAKIAAYLNLRKADNAFLANDNESGDGHLKVGHFLIDIATDFIPFTSIPKDVFKTLVGTDPLTGQKLSSMDRVLSGVFASVSITTLGIAAPFFATIKDIGKVAEAAKDEVEAASKLIDAAKKVSGNLAQTIQETRAIIARVTEQSKTSVDAGKKVVQMVGETISSNSKKGLDFVRGIPGLKFTGQGTWASEAGIIYGKGSFEGNRLRHILLHAEENSAKIKHSVFKDDIKKIPGIIDEGWFNRGIPEIKPNGNKVFDISMNRVIGKNGEDKLRIVIKKQTENEIITAFPVR